MVCVVVDIFNSIVFSCDAVEVNVAFDKVATVDVVSFWYVIDLTVVCVLIVIFISVEFSYDKIEVDVVFELVEGVDVLEFSCVIN